MLIRVSDVYTEQVKYGLYLEAGWRIYEWMERPTFVDLEQLRNAYLMGALHLYQVLVSTRDSEKEKVIAEIERELAVVEREFNERHSS